MREKYHDTVLSDGTYHGWMNYATWNVSLWLNNSEKLYYNMIEYIKHTMVLYNNVRSVNYSNTIKYCYFYGSTPDGISYRSKYLNRRELTEMLQEIAKEYKA